MAKSVLSDLDLNTVGRIINLADPVNAQDAATKAYVLAHSGGGGGLNTASITVDFGTASDYVVATVSAAWILSTSTISLAIIPYTSDHDIEDALLEQLTVSYGNIIDGVSFDVHVHAPSDTWGRYIIKIMGA